MSGPFKVAALFVQKNGAYFGNERIDPWDASRDARKYAGPWPVVAHPPCERWGRYWSGGPMLAKTDKAKKKGDDGGCFAAALAAVRKYGGVLEHPEASAAWSTFGLNVPPIHGGWVVADWEGGWTCCVAQGHYGHKAEKLTWLYAKGVVLPSLQWGRCHGRARIDDGFHSKEERRKAIKCGTVARLTRWERSATPREFRNVLLSIAGSALWVKA